jgi:hypothetical protein
MQKWEYRWLLETRGANSIIEGGLGKQWNGDMNLIVQWGEEGWELVSVVPRSGVGGENWSGFTNEQLWIFKRPKN